MGSFPEPVLLLDGDQVIYANEPGQALLQEEAFPAELLAALAEHPGSAMETALGEAFYRVTVSPYDVGMLVVLRPLPPAEEKRHPFSNAVYRMRECLSNFTAVQFRMKRVLQEHHLLGGLEQDLANQSRLIYQMLRLTRQAELTQELNDKAFPREEGFDLAMVCQGMADEATWLADLAGVRFTYTSNVEHLPFQGSKSLLTQMLLALVSERGPGRRERWGGGDEAPRGERPVRHLPPGHRRGHSGGPDGHPLLRRCPGGAPPPRGRGRPGPVQRPTDCGAPRRRPGGPERPGRGDLSGGLPAHRGAHQRACPEQSGV